MEKFTAALNETILTLSGRDITLLQLLLIPVIFLAAWWAYRWFVRLVVRKLENSGADKNVINLVRRILLILFVLIVAVTVLDLLQVPITAFAFVSGAVAIGVGFGAQNIINNFISGWILMWERPIRIGDFLEIGDVKGSVESINTRSTLIRRVDGVHLLVPNSQLLENTVVNWTLIDRLARTFVRVGVAYGSPVKRVHELLLGIVEADDHILKDPAPFVIFEDFADNSLVFDIVFWAEVGGERDLRIIRSDMRFAIDKAFAENGIVIAFPQRDVHLNSVAPIEVRVVKD